MNLILWGMLITFSLAALDWYAVFHNSKPLKWITKPLVLLFLIVWLGAISGFKGPLVWFGIAALLSLAGDVLLMLPDHLFPAGMLAFLAAHVLYIVGLNREPLRITPLEVGIAVLLGAGILFQLIKMEDGVWKSTHSHLMVVLTAIYGICITGMLLSAFSTLFRPGWALWSAVFTTLGGGLFFLSDTLLATDRFVNPLSNGRLLVRITYHTGQIFLLGGVFLHFLPLISTRL